MPTNSFDFPCFNLMNCQCVWEHWHTFDAHLFVYWVYHQLIAWSLMQLSESTVIYMSCLRKKLLLNMNTAYWLRCKRRSAQKKPTCLDCTFPSLPRAWLPSWDSVYWSDLGIDGHLWYSDPLSWIHSKLSWTLSLHTPLAWVPLLSFKLKNVLTSMSDQTNVFFLRCSYQLKIKFTNLPPLAWNTHASFPVLIQPFTASSTSPFTSLYNISLVFGSSTCSCKHTPTTWLTQSLQMVTYQVVFILKLTCQFSSLSLNEQC